MPYGGVRARIFWSALEYLSYHVFVFFFFFLISDECDRDHLQSWHADRYMRNSSGFILVTHTESLMSYKHSPGPSGSTTEETISGPCHRGSPVNHSLLWQRRQQEEMALTCMYTPHLKRLVFNAAAAQWAVCARRQWQVAKVLWESGCWNEEVLRDGRHQGKQFGNQVQAHRWTSEEP